VKELNLAVSEPLVRCVLTLDDREGDKSTTSWRTRGDYSCGRSASADPTWSDRSSSSRRSIVSVPGSPGSSKEPLARQKVLLKNDAETRAVREEEPVDSPE
jgi:hypothetical protein